jgi:septal ring factor EnvC (AmiA/AmiB activator)
MLKFDSETKEYEAIISDANTEKQKIRKEIAKLESSIRTKRDHVADLQVENRNLQYLMDKE